jgi:hypothetical protein
MNTFFRMGLWLALALLVTSCLTFEENYTFNQDGSGQMELAIDMAELAAMVPEGPQRDTLFQMGEAFNEVKPELGGLVGISQVETFEDRENFRLGIRYQFSDVAALNRALNAMLVMESMDDSHEFFQQEDNQYVRSNLPKAKGITLIDALAQSFMAEAGNQSDEVGYLLESMKYQMNMDFARRVKLVYAQAEAEVKGEDREQVSIVSSFSDILRDRDELSASFVLK